MPDLSPVWGAALGAIGGLIMALVALLIRRPENEEKYQAWVSLGAFAILAGFLFQALPYIPCLAKGTSRLIASWSIVGISLAYMIFIIVWYRHHRAKKNLSKSTKKPK